MAEMNTAVLKALLEMLEDYHAHSNPLLDLVPLKVSAIALAQDPELARRFRAVLVDYEIDARQQWMDRLRHGFTPYGGSVLGDPNRCSILLSVPPGTAGVPCNAPKDACIHEVA